jgi:hypothetical protein
VYLPLVLQGQGTAPTLEPPQQAGTARYVQSDWQEFRFEPLVGRVDPANVRLAYARGYNAFAGQPFNTLILAFGRQLEPGRTLSDGTVLDDEWHVFLVDPQVPFSERAKNRDWIVETSVFFVRGYLQNPNHPNATIAIGTSNANYAWDCDNRGSGSVDQGDFWQAAGEEWREVIRAINNRLSESDRERVTIVGANDIESWFREGSLLETEDANGNPLTPPEQAWIGCADGTFKWFDGWELASSPEAPPQVINFGSNTFAEVEGIVAGSTVGAGASAVRARFDFGNQWTRDDLLEVIGKHPDSVRRRPYIRNYPQIYCPNQETSWINFTEWTIENRIITNTYFNGVTSEDAGSGLCSPADGLLWEQSWTTLNNALLSSELVNDAQVSSPLRRFVSSFYHSQLGRDEP